MMNDFNKSASLYAAIPGAVCVKRNAFPKIHRRETAASAEQLNDTDDIDYEGRI